jgi:hypothetical protein
LAGGTFAPGFSKPKNMKKKSIPPTLQKILIHAPMAWGMVAIYDYKHGGKTVKEIKREWEQWKAANPEKKDV